MSTVIGEAAQPGRIQHLDSKEQCDLLRTPCELLSVQRKDREDHPRTQEIDEYD
jgi:hypothetical protein